MHNCPDCGQTCGCDHDEAWRDAAAVDCGHWCDDLNDLDLLDDEDDEDDEDDDLADPDDQC